MTLIARRWDEKPTAQNGLQRTIGDARRGQLPSKSDHVGGDQSFFTASLGIENRRRLHASVRQGTIPTSVSYRRASMLVTDKGQVTIPKHIRVAAGVAPGSEVSFSLEGSRIVITPMGTGVKDDRRAKLRAAAAKVRGSLNPEFKQLKADEIMKFIRGDETIPTSSRRGSR